MKERETVCFAWTWTWLLGLDTVATKYMGREQVSSRSSTGSWSREIMPYHHARRETSRGGDHCCKVPFGWREEEAFEEYLLFLLCFEYEYVALCLLLLHVMSYLSV
ncbi:hypothetical protein VTJ04DRAFT_225 [Mycothermus thermophilus]|uniref:uncharacterized protein n=1 Tax=Humicola insolens TaxID=85995 RepID=UPI0037437212